MKLFLPVIAFLIAFIPSRAQHEDRFLLKAYHSGSPKTLEAFFNKWARETAPLSTAQIARLNDTARNAYLVFRAFYDPFQTGKVGTAWNDHLYDKSKYLVLQDRICIAFVDTLDKEMLIQKEFGRLSKKLNITPDSVAKAYHNDQRNVMRSYRFQWPEPTQFDTILHFRPQVSFHSPKTVVLTDEYDLLLSNFLGNDNYVLNTGVIVISDSSKKDGQKRENFLGTEIKVWYRTRTGHWQFLSVPYTASILFDNTFDNALVNYTLYGEGGYAYFKKIHGAWSLIEADRTWVE